MNASSIRLCLPRYVASAKAYLPDPTELGVPTAPSGAVQYHAASVNVCLWPVDCDGGGKSPNPDFNEESINAVKIQPDGAATDGDSIFLGIAESYRRRMGFTVQQGILGPILALLVYNIRTLCRWYALKLGYRAGTTADAPSGKSGLMDRVTYIASIAGLMVVGAMGDRQHDRHYNPAELTAGQTTMKAGFLLTKSFPFPAAAFFHARHVQTYP